MAKLPKIFEAAKAIKVIKNPRPITRPAIRGGQSATERAMEMPGSGKRDSWSLDPDNTFQKQQARESNARTYNKTKAIQEHYHFDAVAYETARKNRAVNPFDGLPEGGAGQRSRRRITGKSAEFETLCIGRAGCRCPKCMGGADGGFGSGWLGLAREAVEFGLWGGLKGAELGVKGAGKATRGMYRTGGKIRGAMEGTGSFLSRHPVGIRGALIAGGAGYGYASSEGDGYQAFERAASFGVLGAALGTKGVRDKLFRTGRRATAGVMRGAAKGLGARDVGAWAGGSTYGIGGATAAGAIYGGISEERTAFGGALTGAHAYGMGKFAMRKPGFNFRTGGAVGGIYAMTQGAGAIGMAGGAALGMGGVAAGKSLIKRPMLTMGMIAAPMMVAGSALEAASTLQSGQGDYSLGADGSLALGLHSLRHGAGV